MALLSKITLGHFDRYICFHLANANIIQRFDESTNRITCVTERENLLSRRRLEFFSLRNPEITRWYYDELRWLRLWNAYKHFIPVHELESMFFHLNELYWKVKQTKQNKEIITTFVRLFHVWVLNVDYTRNRVW